MSDPIYQNDDEAEPQVGQKNRFIVPLVIFLANVAMVVGQCVSNRMLSDRFSRAEKNISNLQNKIADIQHDVNDLMARLPDLVKSVQALKEHNEAIERRLNDITSHTLQRPLKLKNQLAVFQQPLQDTCNTNDSLMRDAGLTHVDSLSIDNKLEQSRQDSIFSAASCNQNMLDIEAILVTDPNMVDDPSSYRWLGTNLLKIQPVSAPRPASR